MDLRESFIQHLKSFPSIQKQHKQLLAVSGGVDSVVLCDLMSKGGYDFVIAHCNFGLRGEESERDEQFVRGLAEAYNKEIVVKRFDTKAYAEENKLSIQVAARNLRYDWFREVLVSEWITKESRHDPSLKQKQELQVRKPQSYIFTAHHADDNIETVVMNFFRGTGLQGLTGMDTEYKRIFRPLLPFRKQEILDYAKEHNFSYVEDSSNANSYYTRNYFRNELLPAISKVFPQVEGNILKNIERLQDVSLIFDEAIQAYKSKLLEVKGNEEHIPILKLQKQTAYKTILWEILKEKNFTAQQVDEVIKLMDGDNGSYIESSTHRIIRNRRWLIIAPKQPVTEAAYYAVTKEDKVVHFSAGQLKIETVPVDHYSINADKNIIALDESEVEFPLLLRKWKQGDYFYPLGMQKKKKLSKFFIDQKLSLIDKENTWILESGKKIVWIVGQRIDDRFKIKPLTKAILKLSFTSLV